MPPLVVLGNPPSFRSSDPLKDGPVPGIHALPGEPPLVFVVEGSRLFEVDPELFAALSRGDEEAQADLLAACAHIPSSTTGDAPLPLPNAISLNIAQSCNLSCSYCYADEGRFGGRAVMMSHEVARAAIDQLFDGTPERRVTVGFIGGEPFLNREVLYSAVDYAAKRARDTGST